MGETIEITTQCARQRRKLSIIDSKAIARLVATRKLTETESCLMLGIEPKQWFSWKGKQKRTGEFSDFVMRMTANKIDGLLTKIENAGDDFELQTPDGKVINKRGDWRANAWIAERIAPRFAQQTTLVTEKLQVIDISSMRRAYDTPPRALDTVNLHPDCETMSGQRAIELTPPSARLGAKVKSKIPAKKAAIPC